MKLFYLQSITYSISLGFSNLSLPKQSLPCYNWRTQFKGPATYKVQPRQLDNEVVLFFVWTYFTKRE